jgi:hypothetical protein
MKDLRYIEDEGKFLDYSYQALKVYFSSREQFISFYDLLKTTEQKNKFLEIISKYKFLVLDGDFFYKSENGSLTIIDYLNDTYKILSIFALIEFLYEESPFIDFYEWLKKNKLISKIFEKEGFSESRLDALYSDYKNCYGASKKIEHFFLDLDSKTQDFILKKFNFFTVGAGQDKGITIGRIAKELYEFRSNFVHEVKIISQLSGSTTFFKRSKNKFASTNLSIKEMGIIFERGLLRLNGYSLEYPNNLI